MRAVAASAASNSSIYRVLPSLVEFVGAYGSLRRVKPFDDRTLAVWFKRITLQSLPRCVYGETTTPLPVYECRLFFMILEDGEVVYNSLVGEPGVRVVPWSLQKQTHFVLNDDADRRRVVLRRGFSIVFYHQRALGPPSRLFEIPWHACKYRVFFRMILMWVLPSLFPEPEGADMEAQALTIGPRQCRPSF